MNKHLRIEEGESVARSAFSLVAAVVSFRQHKKQTNKNCTDLIKIFCIRSL